MNQSYMQLSQAKLQLEEALESVNLALESEEYKKPFNFKLENPLLPRDFYSPVVKVILERCIDRQIGFDPNLTLQHIESEVLDQFNDIVKKEIKGRSVETLMTMRHELELFMLTDRKKQHEHNLKNVNADLDKLNEQIEGLSDKSMGSLSGPISLVQTVDLTSKNVIATIGPKDEKVAKKKK